MRPSRPAVLVLLLATLLLTPLLSAGAAAGPAARTAAKPDPEAELRRLTREADRLDKAYRGQVQSLEDIRVRAGKATTSVKSLRRSLEAARTDVVRFAQTSYMGAPLDGGTLLSFQGDVSAALGGAATMSYLASLRSSQLSRIQDLIKKAEKAEKTAGERIAALKADIARLKKNRVRIEGLLAKYGFETPSGSDGLTPRMVGVRNEVLRNFPMPYSYGCLRPGDPGDHGSGRACDFMMSGGGRMPSPADKERGDRLAQWVIDNGPRLGVMYLIWQQRYYDVRSGGGWRMMSDRGGVTANHYDHVHVSVF
ncbi:coiled-coil domain-containing protein [Streptosporangium sp. NPDC004379]|uniref:coiled-coil domain-containing protein n=1 Tax=Streptosporangium sp. NPDC004379 TaxID=3366189 RepID=UPI00368A9856